MGDRKNKHWRLRDLYGFILAYHTAGNEKQINDGIGYIVLFFMLEVLSAIILFDDIFNTTLTRTVTTLITIYKQFVDIEVDNF